MTYQERGIATVEAYFQQQGWSYERIERTTTVTPIDTARGRLMCIADMTDQRLVIESLYSFIVPESKRMLVAEFVVRANCQIEASVLSLNLDDGAVGIKTGIALGDQEWDIRLVGVVMRQHLDTADRWLSGLAAVCFADVSPQRALGLCADLVSMSDAMEQANRLLNLD